MFMLSKSDTFSCIDEVLDILRTLKQYRGAKNEYHNLKYETSFVNMPPDSANMLAQHMDTKVTKILSLVRHSGQWDTPVARMLVLLTHQGRQDAKSVKMPMWLRCWGHCAGIIPRLLSYQDWRHIRVVKMSWQTGWQVYQDAKAAWIPRLPGHEHVNGMLRFPTHQGHWHAKATSISSPLGSTGGFG